MATDAQIQANRRNSARSTGPKTDKGKNRVKMNAWKHGGRAKTTTALPVLPQEDPRELEARIQEWLDDWQPRTAEEAKLVERGAKLTCLLERGERVEAAHLGKRVRKALRKVGPTAPVSARRMKVVVELGRKLFYDYRPLSLAHDVKPKWNDDPAVFVAGLEETIEGCRWLLDRWAEMRFVVESPQPLELTDLARFVRLMGKNGYEAINDPALNAVFQVWELCDKGCAKMLWEFFRKCTPPRDPLFNLDGIWREFAPPPADWDEGYAVLDAVMKERVGRLKRMVAELSGDRRGRCRRLRRVRPQPCLRSAPAPPGVAGPRAAPHHRRPPPAPEAGVRAQRHRRRRPGRRGRARKRDDQSQFRFNTRAGCNGGYIDIPEL